MGIGNGAMVLSGSLRRLIAFGHFLSHGVVNFLAVVETRQPSVRNDVLVGIFGINNNGWGLAIHGRFQRQH